MGWSKGVNWLKEALKAKELKKLEEAKRLEDYRRLKAAEVAKFRALKKAADEEWRKESIYNIQRDLDAQKIKNPDQLKEYLIKKYGLSSDSLNTYYNALSSDNRHELFVFQNNNNIKDYFYNKYYAEHAGDIDYKQYYKPTNETPNTEPLSAPLKNEPIRDENLTDVHLKNEPPEPEASNNATKAVTPEAKAINATTTATTEIPKEPTSAGMLKNALSKFKKDPSNRGLDPKDPKVIGKTLKIVTPGTIAGGVSGEFVTDDGESWQTHLRNILTGAALGAIGKTAYHQLHPKLPSKGKMLKYGAELGTIGGVLYHKENIKDYANKLWNPTTSKPEDTSPPIETPVNTPVNTNRQASRDTSKHIIKRY